MSSDLSHFVAKSVVPIVLCIDLEPDLDFYLTEMNRDERATANLWDAFNICADFFESLRKTLPIMPIFSWFVRADPQIAFDFGSADYAFTRFADYIENWRAHGDEIGLHVHAWRQDSVADRWIDDRSDQNWVSNCILTGFDAYRNRMEQVPKSFRFGGRWINTPTMNLITELGTRVDMSLEPGFEAFPNTPFLRGFPDWRNVPRSPYAPSPEDYTRPSEKIGGRLIELPLTTVIVSSARKLEKMLGIAKDKVAGRKNISQVPHGPVSNQLAWYLRSRYGRLDLLLSSDQFRKATRSVLSQTEHPYFGLILRSDDCQYEHARSAIRRNMENLIEEIRARGRSAAFATPETAAEILGYAFAP